MAAWTVNWDAVDRARDTLGLNPDSCIHITKRPTKHMSGRHNWDAYDNGVYWHRITVGKWLDYREASKTLWHELTHAQQLERMGPSVYNQTYTRGLETLGIDPRYWRYVPGYDDLPLEREARANEYKYRNRLLVYV